MCCDAHTDMHFLVVCRIAIYTHQHEHDTHMSYNKNKNAHENVDIPDIHSDPTIHQFCAGGHASRGHEGVGIGYSERSTQGCDDCGQAH